jgi:(2S)-methylsuccinyl-CoA dehydrogenase
LRAMGVGPDLAGAAAAVDLAGAVVDEGVRHLATTGDVDVDEVLAYDLAHSAAAIENARAVLDYGSLGEVEARIACAFVADAVYGVATRTLWR